MNGLLFFFQCFKDVPPISSLVLFPVRNRDHTYVSSGRTISFFLLMLLRVFLLSLFLSNLIIICFGVVLLTLLVLRDC